MRLTLVSSRWWRCMRAAAAATLCMAAIAGAQNLQSDSPNGISVGRPKVFDDRSLSIMLDQLNQQLQTVETIDATKLGTALTNQQGAESHAGSVSASLAASGVPGAAGAADKANPQPPSPPGAATLPTAPSYSPTFGASPADLLADQVNLSYQIFNIRMLLERALSDRLWKHDARLQTVLGFQVSIDPSKQGRDRAAFVEITVSPTASGQCSAPAARDAVAADDYREAPSLVALMPYEKTYNSSAVSSSASAFGGSAVFQIFTLGVNVEKQDQVFYLFRDADTLAMERMQSPPGAPPHSVTFGWQFRPVLGRRSVSPGVRQMFAVVALPEANDGEADTSLCVQERTYWRKYYRDALTTADREDYVRGEYPFVVPVIKSKAYETDLSPKIEHFGWTRVSGTTGVVSFSGKNFFPGTQIQVGDKTHLDTASGLLIKSDTVMELTVPLQDLASGEGFISGRYGEGLTELPVKACHADGIAINGLHLAHLLGSDAQRLDVVVQARAGGDLGDLDLEGCNDVRPLLEFGSTLLPDSYGHRTKCKTKQDRVEHWCYQFSTFVKSSQVTNSDLVTIRYPFRGPHWSDSLELTPRSHTVMRFAKQGKLTTLRLSGESFDENWSVSLDKMYKVDKDVLKLDGDALMFTIDDTTLGRYKQIALLPPATFDPSGTPIVLDIPADAGPPKPAAAKPQLDATAPAATVSQGSAPALVLTGKALSAIKRVTFDDEILPFQVTEDGKTMTVILSRNVTRKPGSAVLILHPASGDFLLVAITVAP